MATRYNHKMAHVHVTYLNQVGPLNSSSDNIMSSIDVVTKYQVLSPYTPNIPSLVLEYGPVDLYVNMGDPYVRL